MLDTLISALEAQFDNDFFTGGIAIAALGVLAALGRAAVPVIKVLVLRYFTVQVSIDSRRPAYRQLVAWRTLIPTAAFAAV